MLRLLREAHSSMWEQCDHDHDQEDDPQQVSIESSQLDIEFGFDQPRNSKEKDKKATNCMKVVGEHMKPSKDLHYKLELY